MNTRPQHRPILSISAKYIGPIMRLDGNLSSGRQNLIFAINGTGKSFIARALTELDHRKIQTAPAEEHPEFIVSEEGEIGSVALKHDATDIARLDLNTQTTTVQRLCPNLIFHVFSSDYVETELRRKSFELDGEISHEIILGQENAELDQKEEQLKKSRDDHAIKLEALQTLYAQGKDELKSRLAIAPSLGGFKSLKLQTCLTGSRSATSKSLDDLASQYDQLKSLPNDPKLPEMPTLQGLTFEALDTCTELLGRSISASTVADDIKTRIAADPQFIQKGLKLRSTQPDHCPFCTQELGQAALEAIDAYVTFFEDAEAKAQQQFHGFKQNLEALKRLCTDVIKRSLVARNDYDHLKGFFPSTTDTAVADLTPNLELLVTRCDEFAVLIDQKTRNLVNSISAETLPDLTDPLRSLETDHRANAQKIEALTALCRDSNAERRQLQNDACRAFEAEFAQQHQAAIDEIMQLKTESDRLDNEVKALQLTHGNTVPAREKVAATFAHLMNYMFGEKYTFDKDRFVVQRNRQDMSRGGDRTLSDGEKTILGFCYYLAQTHLKVETADDYERLFFVVDDPISSVSFDYIYSIAQVLRALRIDSADVVFDKLGLKKPRLLVLTHNDYFYNVIGSNNIIKKECLFELVRAGDRHELVPLRQFVAPHHYHVHEVGAVARGDKEPDYTTPNSIRTVIEGMWRFCRPDLDNLDLFLKFLQETFEISTRSVLINTLSHGGHFSGDSPLREDIVKAAKEAVEIVEKLAPGQLRTS
ncbi:MAG: AAA family ATPase [Paracoccaceae bacterium]